jgi:2-amino-4-hydroxy-6-hydroxymethyldihydropteridine diphosphokinase
LGQYGAETTATKMNTTTKSSPNVRPSMTGSIPQSTGVGRPANDPGPRWDVVVGLGSNLGDRAQILARAVQALAGRHLIEALSPLYETPPLGPAQPDFLNAALRLSSSLPPRGLLEHIQWIERSAARERSEHWGPRTLDLDILWISGC